MLDVIWGGDDVPASALVEECAMLCWVHATVVHATVVHATVVHVTMVHATVMTDVHHSHCNYIYGMLPSCIACQCG